MMVFTDPIFLAFMAGVLVGAAVATAAAISAINNHNPWR